MRKLFKEILDKFFDITDFSKDCIYELAKTDNARLEIINQIKNGQLKTISEVKLACCDLQQPKTASDYYDRATSYTSLDAYDKAEADYTKMIEIAPDDIKNYEKRATFYKRINKYENAEADYTKIIQLQKDINDYIYDGYYKRAHFYSDIEEYEKAENDYISLIHRYPDDIHVLRTTASFYQRINLYDKAEKAYTKAIEISSEYWLLAMYHDRAMFYEKIKKYDKAEDDYKKLVEIDHNKNKELAKFYERIKGFSEAEAQYTQKIEQYPKMS